jgi:hypothetical protein
MKFERTVDVYEAPRAFEPNRAAGRWGLAVLVISVLAALIATIVYVYVL